MNSFLPQKICFMPKNFLNQYGIAAFHLFYRMLPGFYTDVALSCIDNLYAARRAYKTAVFYLNDELFF